MSRTDRGDLLQIVVIGPRPVPTGQTLGGSHVAPGELVAVRRSPLALIALEQPHRLLDAIRPPNSELKPDRDVRAASLHGTAFCGPAPGASRCGSGSRLDSL